MKQVVEAPNHQDTLVAVEEVLSKQAEVASDVFRIVMSSNTLRNNERLSVISREHNFQHFLTRFGRDQYLKRTLHNRRFLNSER